MTDGERGLFDDEPRHEPPPDPSTPDRLAAPARAHGAHVDTHVKPDEVHPRSRAAAIADDGALVSPPHDHARSPDAEERPIPLRLAHLHLVMGSLALARAELESLAGRGMLDEPSLLDLAAVRWRTGDLAGAGEAANALLTRGGTDALALVIAAEAVAAQGRPGEARKLAGRALDDVDGPLEPLFAGIPRSAIWPADVPSPAAADAGAEPTGEPMTPRVPAAAATGMAVSGLPVGPAPASTGAAEAFAGGRAALGAGDTPQAAVRLGVALRLEPGYAREVLVAIGEQAAEPALALVAGDALRLLGRESEALAAFDIARGHVHAPEEPHVRAEADRQAPGDGTPG